MSNSDVPVREGFAEDGSGDVVGHLESSSGVPMYQLKKALLILKSDDIVEHLKSNFD